MGKDRNKSSHENSLIKDVKIGKIEEDLMSTVTEQNKAIICRY
jgi:hypothetical protein